MGQGFDMVKCRLFQQVSTVWVEVGSKLRDGPGSGLGQSPLLQPGYVNRDVES
jgi:hypothetical protein